MNTIINEIVCIARQIIGNTQEQMSSKMVQDIDCGPWNIFKVRKFKEFGVYAHQITQQDINQHKIDQAKSKEGEYKGKFEDYKKVKNWICTDPTKIEANSGKFWLVKDGTGQGEFSYLYNEKEDKNKKMTGKFCDNQFEFYYHEPIAECYCFKLPTEKAYLADGTTKKQQYIDIKGKEFKFGGQIFHPGNYVFISDGKCEPWERAVTDMKPYYLVDNKNYAKQFNSTKVSEQYNEIIQSIQNKDSNTKISKQLFEIAKALDYLYQQ